MIRVNRYRGSKGCFWANESINKKGREMEKSREERLKEIIDELEELKEEKAKMWKDFCDEYMGW